MNRIAWTALVAFVASLVTLWAAYLLMPDEPSVQTVGGLPVITKSELARHDHADSCWKAIEGRVYDVTDYIPDHPTPESVMLEWCGRDSTEAWQDKGSGRAHSRRAERMLEDYAIGVLAD